MSDAAQIPTTPDDAPAVAAVPDVKPELTTTAYLILSSAGNKGWVEQSTVQARGATQAIRDFLKGATDVAGTYVAVPARSWKPLTVSTETQTRIKLT